MGMVKQDFCLSFEWKSIRGSDTDFAAIRSRTQIFEVKPLSEDDMKTAI